MQKQEKKGKDGVGPNKALTQEKTLSPIVENKGRIETSVGSPVKKALEALKKNKGKERVLHSSEKLLVHVHLHSFKEFNIEGDSLLVLLKGPQNVLKRTSFPMHKMKRKTKMGWLSHPRNFWPSLRTSKPSWCNVVKP